MFISVRPGTVASDLETRSVKSITMVLPYPVTLRPSPTKLKSVNPTPILGLIIAPPAACPAATEVVDPIPTPALGLNWTPF